MAPALRRNLIDEAAQHAQQDHQKFDHDVAPFLLNRPKCVHRLNRPLPLTAPPMDIVCIGRPGLWLENARELLGAQR